MWPFFNFIFFGWGGEGLGLDGFFSFLGPPGDGGECPAEAVVEEALVTGLCVWLSPAGD
jgi:hypothetical protein